MLHGPNIAWSVKEFCQQTYTLTTVSYEGAKLIAENKGGNRFEIRSENVAGFTLFLSPEMADVTAKVLLNVNGREFKAVPEAVSGKKDYSHQVNIWVDDLN